MKRMLCTVFLVIIFSTAFANITQSHWRWRKNNGTETSATWKAPQDSPAVINDYNAIRLRMEIYNSLPDTKSFDHGLLYAVSPGGPWYSISDRTPLDAFVFTGDDLFITNNQPTTHQLTGTKYPFVPGNIITNQTAISDSIKPGTSREYEWSIRPTPFIQPFTKYYFKAASGDAPLMLPAFTTGNAFTAKPVYITNGSFEKDLTGWSTTTGNGNATFTPVTSEHHNGTKSLKITVTDKSAVNSVKLIHNPGHAPVNSIYLLRFWCVSSLRNALLNVNIKSNAGDNTCSFKIYDRFEEADSAWQMYQYAFKVNGSPVSLQFSFNSNAVYYLDDVEAIPVNDANVDVRTQYNWQYNQTGYGWLSGDNDNSVLLPDSSVAWIFSDSFLGLPDAHSNIISSGVIVNNVIVHEVNDHYTSVYGGTQSSPRSLFSPGNGNIFWNSGGVVENNKLKILLIEINGGNYADKTYAGTLSLPDLTVEGQVQTSYTGHHSPNSIFQDGAYNYIYIAEGVSAFENYTQVARVPVGALSTQAKWEFYTNNGTWSTDDTKAKRILSGVQGASVVKLGENNYALSGVPNLTEEIAVWFAASPVGPWVNKTVLYHIPEEDGVLPYEGHIDKGSGKDGIYTLSYSVYPFSGGVPQQLSDKGIYIPYYIRANLLQLSPFTTKP